MSLEKLSVIDQIEVLRNGIIQVRKANLIIEDGIEIAKTYHRHCLVPGDDLTAQDERVRAVAEAVWTPDVIKEYEDLMKKNKIDNQV